MPSIGYNMFCNCNDQIITKIHWKSNLIFKFLKWKNQTFCVSFPINHFHLLSLHEQRLLSGVMRNSTEQQIWPPDDNDSLGVIMPFISILPLIRFPTEYLSQQLETFHTACSIFTSTKTLITGFPSKDTWNSWLLVIFYSNTQVVVRLS